MAGNSNTLSKKTIIAIVTIIVLLLIAGLSIGIFLADQGETEAVDGNQVVDQNQTGDDNQVVDGSQTDGDNEEQPGDNEQEEPSEPGTTDGEEGTEPDAETPGNDETQTPGDNNATGNDNTQVTTGTDVNDVGETTITRVEEEERLVSRDYWDWWTPTSVAVASTVANLNVEAPDLDVQKSVISETGSENLVYAGNELTYQITVKNNGTEAVENIEITDKIPQNTTFVSVNDGDQVKEPETIVDENNNVVGIKWIVTVEPEKTAIVSFTVKVNENVEGTIVNTAVANGEESNETHTAIIKNEKSSVIMRNDNEVEIAKEGDQIIYTITAINTGDTAGEILIQDTVPEGTSLVSAEGAIKSVDEETGKTILSWTNVNVPAVQDGGKASVQFTVKVEDIDKEIKNIATVGGNETDENEVPTADIEVIKEVVDIKRDGVSIGKDVEVKAGDVIEYTITVTNTGSVELTNIVIDEQLKGIEIDGNLTIDSLAVGEQYVLTATYTVTHEKDIQGNADQTVYNKVVVTGDMPVDPENPGEPEKVEDEDDETTPVEDTPGVNVVKVANKTENVKAGETINYTITVTNTGNVTLENIPVTDTITTSEEEPINLPVYSDVDCTIEVTEIESLGVGETATLYAKYTVTQDDIDTQTTISNIAYATVPGEEKPTPSDPVPTTPETPAPGIVVEKTATAVKKNGEDSFNATIERVRPGDVIEYTITVDNTGNTTLTGIIVTDSLEVTVNGDVKEVDEETGVSTIATIDSLAPDAEPVVIKAYYTVTDTDAANLDTIYNVATATVPDGPSGEDDDKTVPVNKDTSVTVNKIWNDNQNQDGMRPETITINLFADGKQVKSETISGTTYTFEKLPTYNEDGTIIVYTVTENAVADYTTTYSQDTFTITNTHTPETIDIPVIKEWNDNNNQDNVRPSAINVTLNANGTEKETIELTSTNNWTYTFEDLPKYENGVEIRYEIIEPNVPDTYTSVVTGDKTSGFTITNTHDVFKTEVPVTKVWDDADDQDGIRPESVTVTLYANGTATDKTVTLSEANDWADTFTNLDVNANGTAINYTVKENNIPDTYTSVITGSATEGYTITNTHEVDKTEITVTKSWVDANNQDGIRPESVSVTLYADEVATDKTVTLSEANKWTATFTGLDVNADGEKISYTVQENDVPDTYTSVVTGDMREGYTITNTHIPYTMDIPVTKVWNDADNQDGKRPTSIEVILSANGTPVDSIELNENNDWTHTFTGLAVNNAGEKITYSVNEKEVPEGYTANVTGNITDGFTVTNTHVTDKTSITIEKSWVDANDQDGIRPESVDLTLYANGEEVDTVTVSESTEWKYTFTDLPVYENGQIIEYTVDESVVTDGYSKEIKGYVVENTHIPAQTEVTVSKEWNDNENQDGIRPKAVVVTLYADGNATNKTVTLSNANGWTDTFTNLPVNANGKEIKYTVQEEFIAGYTPEITGNATDGYTITNTHNVEKTSVEVNKVWTDGNNQDGMRTDSVNVTLYANGVATEKTVTLSAENDWSATFADLDKKANGKDIAYTVVETVVPAGYTAEVTGDASEGYTITNTHIPATTEITVNKAWEDNNNQDGIRPQSVSVSLLANGELKQTVNVTAAEEWTYTFTNLPVNANGTPIVYTVVENNVKTGYTANVTGNTTEGYTITNTHTPETTSVTVTKAWNDNGNQDGMRTESVSVSLMNGTTVVDTQTLSNTNSWTYTFANLPKYANGTQIAYTVKENNVPNSYTAEVTGNITDGFTITNTHTPITINIPVTKVWKDNENYYDARTAIEVTLNANGTPVQGQTVTITADDGWTHTFESLPKYQNGVEIDYTITEKAVERYQTAITGDATTGFTITNTYNNVVVNKKTLTSSESSETTEQADVDVVFVLDISGSMDDPMGNGDKSTRAEAMVNATNKAITEIMKNKNNRVGVVMFSGDVTTALPLNHYTPKSTSNNVGQYLEFESEYDWWNGTSYYISTNVNGRQDTKKQVVGGTYTQLGIATGANMLANATNTDDRTPVIILLTDGEPTYADTDYDNVTSSYDVGDGTSSSRGDRGYLTILTANAYKNKVDQHYADEDALMYTIGLGMSGDYAEAVLNPNTENVNACRYSDSNAANDLYDYLTRRESTIETNGRRDNEVEVRNPYNDYNYADGSYSGEMSSEELEDILTNITESINKHYKTTTTYTTNIDVDTARIELENLDVNEKITIILDDQSTDYTVQDLISSGTVIQEAGKYYIDLKASMFTNIKSIDITYYEVSTLDQ